MDLPILEGQFNKAKFKNLGVKLDGAGNLVYPGWTDKYEKYWSGPKKEFMGQSLAPFKHNYAYGYIPRETIHRVFRMINEDADTQKMIEDVLKYMDATVGGHDTTAHLSRRGGRTSPCSTGRSSSTPSRRMRSSTC